MSEIKIGQQVAEGKAKKIFATSGFDKPIFDSKNDTTACPSIMDRVART